MRNWVGLTCLVVVGSGLPAAAAARTSAASPGDDQPALLVVVEVAPGSGHDAAEVREAIRAEIGGLIASPSQPMAGDGNRTLIVAVDRSRVVMSFQRSTDSPVARSIAVPAERGARLRAIAWLARNLARDQVSGIVAAPGLLAHTPPDGPPPVIPAEFPAIQPPALQETPKPEASEMLGAPVAVRTASATPVVSAASGWRVTMAGGPTTLPRGAMFAGPWSDFAASSLYEGGTSWSLEAHRHTATMTALGMALDVGRWRDAERIGAAGFMGSRRARGRWAFETNVGVGIEAATTYIIDLPVISSSEAGVTSTTRTHSELRGALYLRGGLSGLVDISDSMALMARVGVHLSTLGNGDVANWLVGVRVKLP